MGIFLALCAENGGASSTRFLGVEQTHSFLRWFKLMVSRQDFISKQSLKTALGGKNFLLLHHVNGHFFVTCFYMDCQCVVKDVYGFDPLGGNSDYLRTVASALHQSLFVLHGRYDQSIELFQLPVSEMLPNNCGPEVLKFIFFLTNMQGRPALSNRFRVYRERPEIPICMQMDRSRLAVVMTDLLANRRDAATMREVLDDQFFEPSIDVETIPR